MAAYAHTLEGRPPADWQKLEEHLSAVAERAARSGAKFEAADWGRIAGLWHDIGKYSDAFQAYLRSGNDLHSGELAGKVDHSTAGAIHAASRFAVIGHLLAYVIAGHHSGLLDARSDRACLERRLAKRIEPWEAPAEVVAQEAPDLPPFVAKALGARDAFAVAFFARMVFSCLVDADFLDTEGFMDPARARHRPAWPASTLFDMEQALDRFVAGLETGTTRVDRRRADVRRACLAAAEEAPGLFSLTVPTGGGKTLSALAFALRHAIEYGLKRVIYVVPFTTIIEQNAEVFRRVMSGLEGFPDPVVEHHSDLDVGRETTTSRLAAENWDAPLVVTTSVQFYESLFANRTRRCRKLHNLARAVVILDEAQSLPVDYLEPCLRALRELTENYGASVVLCTATQPAVRARPDFGPGLRGVREVIPDPTGLYRDLKRVAVRFLGLVGDHELADRIRGEKQVLCVVNTRRHARVLYESLGDSDVNFHLSALMCPEHRKRVLEVIRGRLASAQPCRVVSTQLVEAGVDIDFPVVLRSLAGLDSIAQAAGRCNRNGLLRRGTTFVFEAEHTSAEQYFAETANCGGQVLPLYEDPISLEAIEHYFRLYYWEQSDRWDTEQIMRQFALNQDRELPFLFSFATVARRFRLIDDETVPVIIPWGKEGRALRDELMARPPDRLLLRRLQRFSVQLRRRVWEQHVGKTFDLVHDRFGVLIAPQLHYSDRIGLDLDSSTAAVLMS